MALGFNLTNYAAAMKKRYARQYVDSLVYKDKPFMAMVKKFDDMGGSSWEQPVNYSDSQARGYTVATAQALAGTEYNRISTFAITRVKDFGIAWIDGELIEASKKDEDAFFRTTTQKVDSVHRTVGNKVAVDLYRKGWGAIGNINATVAGTTLTLTNPEDIVNFNVGNVLRFSASEDSNTLRAGATPSVSSIDRSAGTMVVSVNLNTVTGITASDFIFIDGDREDSATPTRRHIAGLEDWIPFTAPTSTTFFGVNRLTDSRLGGCRFDGSSAPIEEALIEAGMLTAREGGSPDTLLMNPKKFGDLVKALGTKIQYVDVKTASVGFRALELHLPTGTIKVMADRYCPVNRAFLLQLDTWMLGSLGGVPRFMNHNGNSESFAIYNDDGIEVRVGYYGNLICTAPAWNCNIKL